jgi:cysteinyl-tRNA synthetase
MSRMTLRLYDTAVRAVRDFRPRVAGEVGIYLCGATVQSPPHIGHIRSGLNFDVLRRWLEHRGASVTFIRNVTDIDDKILSKARDAGLPWWAWAALNERAFSEAYTALGCLAPTYEPRATGHVPEMTALMQRLIDAGHAYASGGDVYFDVRSFAPYGALSGQDVANMLGAGDTDDDSAKRDGRDFALWKGAKPGEPSWETPWGPGRPGWHLECSAMARRYLGPEFDIHGGGLDLVFPHHENEIAQSRAAGDPFARYWMHNAWVTTAGEKMSKSLGNSLLVADMVKRVPAIVLRYYLVAAHYRSTIEFSEEALGEAGTAFHRVEGFVRRAREALGDYALDASVPDDFAAALDDDLGVPQGLAVLHDTVHRGNKLLAEGGDRDELALTLGAVQAMLDVLGLDPAAEPWASSESVAVDARLHGVVDALVRVALEQRQVARERQDYAASDAIRDQLARAGIAVEDTPAGPRWSVQPGSP